MSETFNTRRTSEPVCPYCGTEARNENPNSHGEIIECEKCHKSFGARRSVEITYTSWKNE